MINEENYNKIISKNLKRLAYEHEKSQADIARDLGISKATLSSWMTGTRTPKIENIDMLCKYFGVDRSAIMEPDGIKRTSPISEEQAELIQLALSSDSETVHIVLDLLRRLTKI